MYRLKGTLIVCVLFVSVFAMYTGFNRVNQRIDVIAGDSQLQYLDLETRIDVQVRTLGRMTDKIRRHRTCLEELYKEFDLNVLDACGIITDGFGHGSCVAIDEDLILTAGHCLDHGELWVEINERKFDILEQWTSEKYDIGFVRIDGKVPFVRLATSFGLLDEVYLIGAPYDTKLRNSITKGIVSAFGRNMYGRECLIQVDAEGAPGSSGCPLLNIDGEIIGICVAGPNPGGGVTLCIPVWQVRSALRTYLSR